MQDMMRLVEPLIPALRRYAHGLTHDPALADDLVQDALERAISRWGQRRANGDTRVWLFAIVHNLACDGFRRTGRRGREVALDEVDASGLSIAPQQEERLMQADVLTAMAALATDQKAVLLLVEVEDLTYAQAAAVLGVPLGTVMSRLSRARTALRRRLDLQQDGETDRPRLRVVT